MKKFIQSKLNSNVMDVKGGGTPVSATEVINYPLHGGPNQQWVSTLDTGGIPPRGYQIQSQSPGNMVLDVPYSRTTPGTPLTVYPPHNGLNQMWGFDLLPGQDEWFYLVTALDPTMCAEASSDKLAPVTLNAKSATVKDSQLWRLVDVED